MGDPFRTLTPGDPVGAGEGPFNAQWHNMATEAIRVSQRATPPGMTPREVVKERDTEIWVANVSEDEINEYRPVGLGTLAIYPAENGDFRERLCFLSDKLDDGRPFGIVQEPIGAGKLYACIVSAGPGGQPPNKKWLRLIGEPEPWDYIETYALGEQVNYIGPASPWTDGQGYVIGDLAEADGVVYRCVAVHVAEPGNGPPNADFWEVYEGKDYVALVKHSGRVPPTNPAYWLLLGPHRGIWNRGDTYAPGDLIVDPQLGRIIVDGVSRARITVTQASHQYVTVDDGVLTSALSGPTEILWRQGGIGEQWAVVRLCCNGLEVPQFNGEGEGLLPLLECAGDGTFIFRPGGALVMGAMAGDGVGTHSYPVRLGSGSLSLGAILSDGNGAVYDPPPSGRLYLGSMTCAGSGVRTTPPVGSGTPSLAGQRINGFGSMVAPSRIGSGSLSLAALHIASSGGGYTNTAMFVAKMTNPLFDAPTGRWVYDWIEQTINPANGDYQDLAGGKSGNTSAGPFMRERNNTLVGVPVFSLARLRGAWNGQPLYDFEHCCSKGAAAAGGSLMLAAMICDGSGTTDPPPPVFGAGDLATGAMRCEGNGYASAYSVHLGAGTPQLSALALAGVGWASEYSVNIGVGKPQLGALVCVASGLVEAPVFSGAGGFQMEPMTGSGIGFSSEFSVSIGQGTLQTVAMSCDGSGSALAPVFSGESDLQCGPMVCAGTGLSSAESVHIGTGSLQTTAFVCVGNGLFLPVKVGVGNLQLGAILCAGIGAAWVDTVEVSAGGVAAGGSHQVLADLGADGGIAAGGSHQVLADLGTDGGVAAGGDHQVLADLATDGGVALGGSHVEGGGIDESTHDL